VLLLNVLERTPALLSWLYILTLVLTIVSGLGYGLRGFGSSKDSYR
jgi:hypothetical protein